MGVTMGGFRSVLLVSCLTPLSSATAQFAVGTAGILGGVAVSPQPISVGAPATILLSGAGECGQVTVNFGDGTSKTLTGVKFASDAQTQHTYSRSGNLTITALAGTDCNATGEVKTSVIVEAGSLAEILCVLTGCDEPARPRPLPCTDDQERLLHLAPRAQGGGHHPRVRVRGCRGHNRAWRRAQAEPQGLLPLSRHCRRAPGAELEHRQVRRGCRRSLARGTRRRSSSWCETPR